VHTGGEHDFLPFIALGASIHMVRGSTQPPDILTEYLTGIKHFLIFRQNASNPDIDFQGNHKASYASYAFFQSTFDFSGLLDGGYDRSNSMVLGAQVNLPCVY
jgi:hypothetical protein